MRRFLAPPPFPHPARPQRVRPVPRRVHRPRSPRPCPSLLPSHAPPPPLPPPLYRSLVPPPGLATHSHTSQLTALRQRVLATAKPKMMFGRALTGPMFATLVQQYCSALNDSKTPVIRSAWDRVAETQCEDAQVLWLPLGLGVRRLPGARVPLVHLPLRLRLCLCLCLCVRVIMCGFPTFIRVCGLHSFVCAGYIHSCVRVNLTCVHFACVRTSGQEAATALHKQLMTAAVGSDAALGTWESDALMAAHVRCKQAALASFLSNAVSVRARGGAWARRPAAPPPVRPCVCGAGSACAHSAHACRRCCPERHTHGLCVPVVRAPVRAYTRLLCACVCVPVCAPGVAWCAHLQPASPPPPASHPPPVQDSDAFETCQTDLVAAMDGLHATYARRNASASSEVCDEALKDALDRGRAAMTEVGPDGARPPV
jgi:hypothetical protein